MKLKDALTFYNFVTRYSKKETFWENEKGELECFSDHPFLVEDLFADDWVEDTVYKYEPCSLTTLIECGINVMRPVGMFSDKIVIVKDNYLFIVYLEKFLHSHCSPLLDDYKPTSQELLGKWVIPDLTPKCKELLGGMWPFNKFEIITERKKV